MKTQKLQLIFGMLCFLSISLSTLAQSYSGGAGTFKNPYLVANLTDLVYLSEHSEDWTKKFKQVADIDASSTATMNGGNGFFPIGTAEAPFFGAYNGQGYKIQGLTMDRRFFTEIGLFGSLGIEGELRHIVLEGANVIGNQFVGMLVGSVANGVIIGCSASGTVQGGRFIGGLIGHMIEGEVQYSTSSGSASTLFYNSSSNVVGGLIGKGLFSNISNCYSTATTNAMNGTGGFMGDSQFNDIQNCSATGAVSGDDQLGGFCGAAFNTFFTNCYASNTISIVATETGGFIGAVFGSNTNTTTECFYNSTISGHSDTGKGEPKTTAELQDISTYTGWDFTSTWMQSTADQLPILVPKVVYISEKILCGVTGPVDVPIRCYVAFGDAVWYDSPDINVTSGDPGILGTGYDVTIPNLNTTTTFYVKGFNADGFLSTASDADVIFGTKPTLASSTPDERCGPGSVSLSATFTGATFSPVWYDPSDTENSIALGPDVTLNDVLATTNYLVTAENENCVSDFFTVTATILSCETQLASGSCGAVLTEMSQALFADPVDNATSYRFELRSAIDNSLVAFSQTPSNMLRLSWLSNVKFGSNYRVRVQAEVDGVMMNLGTVCNVFTPLPRLSDCNTVLTTDITESFSVTPVQGATDYRIEVRNTALGFKKLSARGSSDNNFRLSWITGIEYNTTYQVRVSAFVNGFWRPFGPTCTVTTPNLTKLSSGSCGITVSTLSQALFSDAVVDASDYRYEVRRQSDNSLVSVSTRGAADNLFRLSWVSGIQLNSTYLVRVSAKVSDVWLPFGTACTVTTPSGMILQGDSAYGAHVSDEQLQNQTLEVYPNPSKGSFTIRTNEPGIFEIINDLGQMIRQIEIDATGKLQIDEMDQGVYILRSEKTGLIRKIVVQ